MSTRSPVRWLWWALAYVSLALGLVGVVLPGLPTVPFILLSAFAAARGSQRLHARLLADPRLGPMITQWQEHGAIARRAKWLATALMTLGAVLLFTLAPRLWMPIVATAIMVTVGTWLWLRPEPRPGTEPETDTAPAPAPTEPPADT